MGNPVVVPRASTVKRQASLLASIIMLLTAHGSSAQSVSDSASRPLRWPAVAVAGGLVAVASLFDQSTARGIHDHPSTGRRATADQLERFGTVTVIGPTVGTLAVVGVLTRRKQLTDVALNTTEAIVVATVAVEALKLTVGRARPRDDADFGHDDFAPFSGNASFPSGHATAAFAFATSLGDAIHRPWARIGLYTLATGTAWARVAQEAHWVSDVVAGAALGIVSAKFASGRHTVFGMRAPRFGITSTGFELSWSTLPWQRAH